MKIGKLEIRGTDLLGKTSKINLKMALVIDCLRKQFYIKYLEVFRSQKLEISLEEHCRG